MQIKSVCLCLLVAIFSCSKKETIFKKSVPPLQDSVVIKNISEVFFNPMMDNAYLKQLYPQFKNSPDTLLTLHRNDSLAIQLNQEVKKMFSTSFLQDSLSHVFKYVKYYFPTFKIPLVYTFTGETFYDNPINYWSINNEMIIGLDWFLGEKNPIYNTMGIPHYLRRGMEKNQFNLRVAESIAKQYIPLDVHTRKFIEKMIYNGKIIIAINAFCPNRKSIDIMNYTPGEWKWCEENEAEMYVYFTEQNYFFSEDRKLDERFLRPAPFSKFYSDFDNESPGRVGVWMGLQICNYYLKNNPEVSITSFLKDTDYLKIFRESKYKPIR